MTGRGAVTALNREWLELAPTVASELAEWARLEPALAGAGDAPGVLDLIRRRPDVALSALFRLGSSGHGLAHRIALQAMLGMVVRACVGRPALLPDAVSELWLAIVDYPLANRPRSIAANLAWTVRRRLRAPSGVVSIAVPDRPAEISEDPDAAGTLARARRLGLIDDLTHRTLSCVYVSGRTSAQAAAELGTTPELVRWRCSRALRRLAGHADDLSA